MDFQQPAPEYLPVKTVTPVYGVSRSRLYLLAGEGKVRMVKCGARTLVCCASVRAYLATLPEAKIGAGKAA